MQLSRQLKTLARYVQGYLPVNLSRWQHQLRRWGQTNDHSEWNQELLPTKPSVHYQFALLAALNDTLADEDKTAIRIEPWPRLPLGKSTSTHVAGPEELASVAAFGCLKERLRNELADADTPRLRELLDGLNLIRTQKADLTESPHPFGRPPKYSAESDQHLVESWKASKLTIKEFQRNQGLDRDAIKKAQARIRARKLKQAGPRENRKRKQQRTRKR